VGDPRARVDLAGLEQDNDVAERAGQGVAAAADREFAAVRMPSSSSIVRKALPSGEAP
jgi:murein tripeptide amidase MpaA